MNRPEKFSESPNYQKTIRNGIFTILVLSAMTACDNKREKTEVPVENIPATEKPVKNNPVKEDKPDKKQIAHPTICINGKLDNPNSIFPRIGIALTNTGATVARVNPDNFDSFSFTCNGAFITGGDDLDTTMIPKSEPVHPKAKLIPPERQKFDHKFYTWARDNKVPTFGECLGMQEVGVWEGEGARLIQHIPDESNSIDHTKPHTVHLIREASVFGLGENPSVFSDHHQALSEPLPPTLQVVGRSRDKIVEAIISNDGLFWGIQWHPKTPEDNKIYENFVEMVREKGKRTK